MPALVNTVAAYKFTRRVTYTRGMNRKMRYLAEKNRVRSRVLQKNRIIAKTRKKKYMMIINIRHVETDDSE